MDSLFFDYPKIANCECKTSDHIVVGRPFDFDLPPPITHKGNFTFSYEDTVKALVAAHITPRQFGLLGEPRVNVLDLNLDLDNQAPLSSK